MGISLADASRDTWFLRPRCQSRAFTLVELLVVIGLIAVLATLIAPSLNTIMRGSQITQAGEMLNGQLVLARQRALARNRPVEVRIYRFGDPEVPGEKASDPSTGKFRAIQSFDILESGTATPIDKMQRLPPATVIDSAATLSSILGGTITKAKTGDPTLPRVGISYQYAAFRFQPDGSTNFKPASDSWFMTVHNINDTKNPPTNYVAVQIDAYNGHIRNFRP